MVRLTWIYDLPKIGWRLREFKYRGIFKFQEGEIAIDCGANVGKITKRMALGGAIVYAFEPDPNAFKFLVENTKEIPNVICLNKAVSDHNGIEKIYFKNKYDEDPEKWSTGSTLLADKPDIDKNNFVQCEVVDLTQFIQKIDKPIGLLKMDIEGEEVKVLNKLIDLKLHKKIRNIVVETHERFPTLEKPTEDLRKKIKERKIKNIDLEWA